MPDGFLKNCYFYISVYVMRIFVTTALAKLEKLLDQSLKDARDNSIPP